MLTVLGLNRLFGLNKAHATNILVILMTNLSGPSVVFHCILTPLSCYPLHLLVCKYDIHVE